VGNSKPQQQNAIAFILVLIAFTLLLTGTGIAQNRFSWALSPSTSNLVFSGVAVNNSQTQPLVVTNTSWRPTLITGVKVNSQAFTAASTSGLPVTVASGASATFQITFSPATSGTFNSRIFITYQRHSGGDPHTMSIPVSGTAGGAAASAVLQSISLNPVSATIAVGNQQQFGATGHFSDNTTQDLTASAVWNCSNAKAATISAGMVTGTAAGAATITASQGGVTSSPASLTVSAPAAAPVSISITPQSTSVSTGSTQQFTASVQNTGNTAVTWQVNNVTNGTATTGLISASGNYTAPASVPNPATVTVTAVSQADPTKSASASVNITAPPAAVSISITPPSATLATGGTQQFSAKVNNTNNTTVTWQVNNVTNGTATTGLISASGNYTAPANVPSPATVTVTAVSQADPTKSASASVNITAPAAVNGTAFYVSTTGNDSNPGSISSPWRTIQHAASTVPPGATVYVRGGVYSESVNITVSGSAAAGPVVFQSYPGETAVVDGTGLTPSTSDTQGLINIVNGNFITIEGFEIRNYTTSNANAIPAGIWVTGSGSNVQLLNNLVHDITTTSEKSGNAFGIAVYGSGSTSIDSITINGNQVYNLRTGNSESVNVDGNVTNFVINNNVIHDNDNIGIDVIGFEGVAPSPSVDFARNGTVIANTIYNISAINNPGEGNQYDADGIYVDGGSNVLIERNLVFNCDLNIEAASEHSGHVSSFITIRNNLVYHGNSVGISIGGNASNVGGSDHITIVNNTLFENDTKNTGSGEFQIQYYATNNVFENNIVYATSQGLFINNYTNSEPSPVSADYNIYFSSLSSTSADFLWNGTDHTGFAAYQSAAAQDSHSQYVDPQFVSLTTPNLQVEPTSPALNSGINLGSTIEGNVDFAGNPRSSGGTIDIGAYEQ